MRQTPVITHARNGIRAIRTPNIVPYERKNLHRLIRIDASALPPGLEGARQILRRLADALRRERALSGQKTYSLDRHIALMEAYRVEVARLADATPGDKKRGRPEGRPL